ncbi:MAG: NUDIX domain-containing protein [Pleurocapsa sp. SU_196_0]|nr:NUDIX domain-containing protein [Pleurocapsa sp. SU_196_0]
MNPIEGAGGIVFNPDGEVLLIRYPGKRGSWDFPKGHIDPGETVQTAAVREVLEEGGVEARIEHTLSLTEYVNPRGEARRVHWFLMRTSSRAATPEPGFRAGFFGVNEALERLAHEQNRELLLEAEQLLASG